MSKAILLMNLGSPNSPDPKDVRAYLKEFLMDERVIDTNYFWRTILVKGIIVPFRTSKSSNAYKSVWTEEGAPLMVHSYALLNGLQKIVSEPVELCMRYGKLHPSIAFESILKKNKNIDEVILVPLYPHYAMSSYETAVEYVQEVYKANNYNFKLSVIPPFFDNPYYIQALANSIKPYLQNSFDKLVFSYHGIPERHVKKSDPTHCHCLQVNDCCNVNSSAHPFCYRHQTYVTTQKVVETLGLQINQYEQTFQSRLGRDPWLTPFTDKRFAQLPQENSKNILVVCPAFVSDCLETVQEIAIEGEETFKEAGGKQFKLIPCMNSNVDWIQALNKIIDPYR